MASQFLGQIDLDAFSIADDLRYLETIPKIPEEYDEFGQGHWQNISLINSSGNNYDTQYRSATEGLLTDHMAHCPGISSLIDQCFTKDHLRMVRTRNLIDGIVIPHRDFIELSSSAQYLRFFIPLEANTQSFHSDESGVFQMRRGEIWRLDASIDHAAVNFSTYSRQFLCLDFISKEELPFVSLLRPAAPFASEGEPRFIVRLPFEARRKRELICGLSALLNRDTFKDLLFATSKLHFRYLIPVAECYEWLIEAAHAVPDREILSKAIALREYLTRNRAMDQRFEIDSWNLEWGQN